MSTFLSLYFFLIPFLNHHQYSSLYLFSGKIVLDIYIKASSLRKWFLTIFIRPYGWFSRNITIRHFNIIREMKAYTIRSFKNSELPSTRKSISSIGVVHSRRDRAHEELHCASREKETRLKRFIKHPRRQTFRPRNFFTPCSLPLNEYKSRMLHYVTQSISD